VSVENFSNFQATITPLSGDYFVGYSFADPINKLNPFETRTTLNQIFNAYAVYSASLSGVTPSQLSVGHPSWDIYGNLTVPNQLIVNGAPSYFGDGTIRAAIYPDNTDGGITIEAADYANINKKNLYLAPHGGNVTVGTITQSTNGLTVSGNVSASGSIFASNLTSIGVPAGAVMSFATSTAPTGWVTCDGGSYSTTTYSNLFAAIGYTFGGSGAVFNVPDMRGMFVRGSGTNASFTNANGDYYSAGTVGTEQADALKSHTHGIKGETRGFAGGPAYDTYVRDYSSGFGVAVNTAYTGDTETRPANIALLYCIKY